MEIPEIKTKAENKVITGFRRYFVFFSWEVRILFLKEKHFIYPLIFNNDLSEKNQSSTKKRE